MTFNNKRFNVLLRIAALTVVATWGTFMLSKLSRKWEAEAYAARSAAADATDLSCWEAMKAKTETLLLEQELKERTSAVTATGKDMLDLVEEAILLEEELDQLRAENAKLREDLKEAEEDRDVLRQANEEDFQQTLYLACEMIERLVQDPGRTLYDRLASVSRTGKPDNMSSSDHLMFKTVLVENLQWLLVHRPETLTGPDGKQIQREDLEELAGHPLPALSEPVSSSSIDLKELFSRLLVLHDYALNSRAGESYPAYVYRSRKQAEEMMARVIKFQVICESLYANGFDLRPLKNDFAALSELYAQARDLGPVPRPIPSPP